jgi:hypothetical protein
MLRFPAYLVIVGLLAAPLALLARGIVCNPAECNCMLVCAGQASHAAAADRRLCGSTKHAPMCGTHQGHHALDYGFIAPIAPTAPLPHAQLAAPLISHEFVALYAQSAVAGFSSAPFEPPRS